MTNWVWSYTLGKQSLKLFIYLFIFSDETTLLTAHSETTKKLRVEEWKEETTRREMRAEERREVRAK